MTEHEFGGDWTTDKLERLRKYLCAYMTIFSKNPSARYYKTIYVDAFAGIGHRLDSSARDDPNDLGLEKADPDAALFKKGSARIALEVRPSFNRFIFIEKDIERVAGLKALRDQFPEQAAGIQVEECDANMFLKGWCVHTDWKRHRAVVFLDPYGMQVEWETLEAIARTKAIDLWLLFPLGVAVNRLLPRDGLPPKKWDDALTRIFGTRAWEHAFYPKREETTLFGMEEIQKREVNLQAIGKFFLDRLQGIFAKVADNPLRLYNSNNVAIYLLCFAAGNPKGAPIAVKIARGILKQ